MKKLLEHLYLLGYTFNDLRITHEAQVKDTIKIAVYYTTPWYEEASTTPEKREVALMISIEALNDLQELFWDQLINNIK